jgi:hypothetical protein
LWYPFYKILDGIQCSSELAGVKRKISKTLLVIKIWITTATCSDLNDVSFKIKYVRKFRNYNNVHRKRCNEFKR